MSNVEKFEKKRQKYLKCLKISQRKEKTIKILKNHQKC